MTMRETRTIRGVEIRLLKSFLAVAEEGQFRRAADRLNLAQSALSTQIRQLEREVGGPLFRRTTRRLEITSAGAALVQDARMVLDAAELGLLRARAAVKIDAGGIVVGTVGPVPGDVLALALSVVTTDGDVFKLELRHQDFTTLVASLRDGICHAAFLQMPYDEHGIVVRVLMAEPRVVALPATHPLAHAASLQPEDVKEEQFVSHPVTVNPLWRDFWLLVDELGHRPRVSDRQAASVDEWLTLISQGEGIDTAPAHIAQYYPWPQVRYVPLRNAAPARLGLAYPSTANPATIAFANALTAAMSSRRPSPVSAP